MSNSSFDSFYDFFQKQSSVSEAKYGYHFNVLDEQCGNNVENSHTNLLMQLLEYKNKYGYVFLESFVSLAGFDINLEDRFVQFKREFSTVAESGKKGRIGVENPDPESLESMQQLGIFDSNEGGMISGPRYFPCSYSQNILNWLKDDVHPSIMSKKTPFTMDLSSSLMVVLQYR